MAESPLQSVDPRLGITPGGVAERLHLAEHGAIQQVWKKLSSERWRQEQGTRYEDYSENGILFLAGRMTLPGKGGIYWAIHDNRVHFSYPFERLDDREKMLLANQVLCAFAHRSEKNDLKSAALAISEKGHFYIAHNTQETDSMQWVKECAEVNVSRVVKQLSDAHDDIARLYVLGGITDNKGKMIPHGKLIGMCMRCVEATSAIMAEDGQVTILPVNDGQTNLKLIEQPRMPESLDGNTAWQVPYALLKKPTLIQFGYPTREAEDRAWERLTQQAYGQFFCSTAGEIPPLTGKASIKEINAYMLEHLAAALHARKGEARYAVVVVVEIAEAGRTRYEVAMEIRGPHDNAVTSPFSTAVSRAALPVPTKASDPHISHVYAMGYDADHPILDVSAEMGDRIIKRVPPKLADKTFIDWFPFNDGKLDRPAIQRQSVVDLVPTLFRGSKQHPASGRSCC